MRGKTFDSSDLPLSDCTYFPGLLDLWPAAADAKTAVGPAHNLHRFRQPVTQAVARGSDRSSRRLMATVRLSVGRATDSHVAGAGHHPRSGVTSKRGGKGHAKGVGHPQQRQRRAKSRTLRRMGLVSPARLTSSLGVSRYGLSGKISSAPSFTHTCTVWRVEGTESGYLLRPLPNEGIEVYN